MSKPPKAKQPTEEDPSIRALLDARKALSQRMDSLIHMIAGLDMAIEIIRQSDQEHAG
jgi:hypothetical protein